jgi:hypothetical protein
MLKIPAEYETDISPTKLTDFSRQVSLCFATRSSAVIFQRALVDKSGVIRTQMGTHNRSESGRRKWDALYDTIP